MADYTKLNLKGDVADSAERLGLAPNLEARFPPRALGLEKSAFGYQRFAPGFRFPFGHKHKEQEEVYVIVSGSARVKLEDDVVDLTQWDAVCVPADTMRGFEAGPDGVELLAIGAPNTGAPREDAVVVPGWWAD